MENRTLAGTASDHAKQSSPAPLLDKQIECNYNPDEEKLYSTLQGQEEIAMVGSACHLAPKY